MRHLPLSEDELEAKLSAGTVEFTIKKVEFGISKAQNEHLKFTFEGVDINGRRGLLWDYLVSPGDTATDEAKRMFAWKYSSICKSIGHPEYYQNEVINPSLFDNETGHFDIELQKGTEGWPDKMRIKKYLPKLEKQESRINFSEKNELNDEIQF